MKVESLMKRSVQTCTASDTLNAAAQLMWNHDCGCLPVVDEVGRVIGMITDRDVCMAALTQGRRLTEMQVSSAMSWRVTTIGPHDSVGTAEARMRASQIRRLPVVDDAGRLIGLLALADIACEANRELLTRGKDVAADEVAATLAAVSRPRKPISAS